MENQKCTWCIIRGPHTMKQCDLQCASGDGDGTYRSLCDSLAICVQMVIELRFSGATRNAKPQRQTKVGRICYFSTSGHRTQITSFITSSAFLTNALHKHICIITPSIMPKLPRHTKQWSSPPTSPISPRYQSILAIGAKRHTCLQCHMSYMKHIPGDVKQHTRFHNWCLYGREWNVKTSALVQISGNEGIYKVDCTKTVECSVTRDLVDIVNRELNAPDEDFWMQGKGAVFLYVKDRVAIGVCVVEDVKTGKWFSPLDGVIVSSMGVDLLCGISRIYVCLTHRRQGIAMELLKCVQRHMIYGLQISSAKIGWSQPSTYGGKLAMKFNGRKHKSGKVLVPVYTS